MTSDPASQAAEDARVIRTALAEARWPVYGPSLREPCYAALDRLLARCAELERERDVAYRERDNLALGEIRRAQCMKARVLDAEALLAECREALEKADRFITFVAYWEPADKRKANTVLERNRTVLAKLSEARDG